MEQRNERVRNPKSSAADGGDLLQSQAQLWIDMGSAMAGLLRRMVGAHGQAPRKTEEAGGEAAESKARDRRSSGQEAA
jgi:hypothetical protein